MGAARQGSPPWYIGSKSSSSTCPTSPTKSNFLFNKPCYFATDGYKKFIFHSFSSTRPIRTPRATRRRRQRGVMAEMKECEEDSELLPVEDREREASWRLNFDGLRTPQHREKDKSDRGLHNFLCALGIRPISS